MPQDTRRGPGRGRRRGRAPRFRSWLGALGALLAAAIPRAAAAEEPRFATPAEIESRLVTAVAARLDLMPVVAAWKYHRGQPVRDAPREAAVLDDWARDIAALGLAPGPAGAFLSRQIELARHVQEEAAARWRSGGGGVPEAPDLATVLRPRLDAVTRDLLAAVYLAAGMPPDAASWAGWTPVAGVAAAEVVRLRDERATLRRERPATLAGLRRIGLARVGTTGDYAPYSSDAGGGLRGLDVALAVEFLAELGLRPVFVRTSWPGLMTDLRAGSFDLALAGITLTDERRREADFSLAYVEDGKTAVVRRGDVGRLSSLAAIDRAGVRVIVNPGGTNEAFVRARIRAAEIVVHPDNRTLFAALAAGRGDVVITDGIEVRLQVRRDPGLAPALPAPLTRAGKAILFPRGSELREPADAWLAPRVADGRVAALLERAVEAAAADPEKRL